MFQKKKKQESFTTCKWGVMYMRLYIYDTKNQNLKLWIFFCMIWNYDHFSTWNTISEKMCTLKKR
jgi:hypothetical protein